MLGTTQIFTESEAVKKLGPVSSSVGDPRCTVENADVTVVGLRVAVVVDTPNIFRCLVEKSGPGFRPAWAELVRKARRLGSLTSAVAVVNAGFPTSRAFAFHRAGYSVVRADGADCDEYVVTSLVEAAVNSDVVLVAGGDHRFAPAAALAREAGRRVVVVTVMGTCAHRLSQLANEIWEMPTSPPI